MWDRIAAECNIAARVGSGDGRVPRHDLPGRRGGAGVCVLRRVEESAASSRDGRRRLRGVLPDRRGGDERILWVVWLFPEKKTDMTMRTNVGNLTGVAYKDSEN